MDFKLEQFKEVNLKAKPPGIGFLEPRALSLEPRSKVVKRVIYSSFALLLIISGLGYAVLNNVGYYIDSVYYTTDCSTATSTGLERWFTITILVAKDVTYADARLLDIAWDILVCQIARVLHGWAFYSYVLCPQLTRLMERNGVPLATYIEAFFGYISFPSVWALGLSLSKFRDPRLFFSALWFILATGYLLAFTTIWNATAGYVNPASSAFRMPDGTFASAKNMNDFSLCYTVNDTRLQDIVPTVVTSPNLNEIQFDEKGLAPNSSNSKWVGGESAYISLFNGVMAKSNSSTYSDSFRDLNFYAATTSGVLYSLGFYGFPNTFILHEEERNDTDFDMLAPTNFKWNSPYSQVFYSRLHGLQLGSQVNDSNSTSALNETFISTETSSYGPRSEPIEAMMTSSLFPMYGWLTDFHLNDSIELGPGIIPYNSTLNFNGTSHPLEAPFVQLSAGCHELSGMGSPCLCYRDMPIPYAINQDVAVCVSENSYVWGFSPLLLATALVVEFMWIIGCWGIWADASLNSKLGRMGRTGEGFVRAALDLATVANGELGPHTSTYKNSELMKSLNIRRTVGFDYVTEDGATKVRLVRRKSRRKSRCESDGAIETEGVQRQGQILEDGHYSENGGSLISLEKSLAISASVSDTKET